MRKREQEVLSGRIGKKPDVKQGRPICIRPYHSDEKRLDEIARKTGEGKATLVRRMIRFALSDKQQTFAANPCRDKLDWLIKNRRNEPDKPEGFDLRLDEILERLGRLEEDHSAAAHQTSVFLRELYMMSSVSFSTLNIVLSKLMELTTPGGADQDRSIRIADGIMVKLIANAIRDLQKCSAFHGIDSEQADPSDLYLAAKIGVQKESVAGTPEPETQYK